MEIVEEALKSGCGAQPLPSPLPLHRQVTLSDRSSFTFSVENEVHNSCCVEFYLQVSTGTFIHTFIHSAMHPAHANSRVQVGEENTKPNVLLELLSQILHEPCFDTLRTKEQLGA